MPDTKPSECDPKSRFLFSMFPDLVDKLPWMPLAELPSPVQQMKKLGKKLGMSQLWIKRDDLNSQIYSGNKPRKFEFILAEAKKMGRKKVLTMGSAGSNHGAAATLFCRSCGFEPILALSPQPVLSYVRNNILVNQVNDAKVIFGANEAVSILKSIPLYAKAALNGEQPPYFMYFGGSSKAGNVGFVEAGLELADQIKKGEMPMPKYLFVATGSCGTHAGLLVGLRLAGLPIQVIGVRIVPKAVTNKVIVAIHANRVAKYLRSLDPGFPAMHFRPSEINLIENYYGGQYGRPTPECKEAIEILKETENLPLDPTYTGKAFAGMLGFIREHKLKDEPTLFWQTLNSVDLSSQHQQGDPSKLPSCLRKYFTDPLYDPEL